MTASIATADGTMRIHPSIEPGAVAKAIAFAIEQPTDFSISEIV